MGFFDSEDWYQIPGAGDYIKELQNYYRSISLGAAGKTAKKGLKALSKGDYDRDPTISSYLAPVRDFYATANRDSEREASMGVGAQFGANNPVLSARVNALNSARNREAAGSAMTNMIPQLYTSFSNTFQQAKDAKNQLQMSGIQSALQAYLQSMYLKKKKGWLSGIKDVGGAIGGLVAPFFGGAFGGASPGGGGGV